MERHFWFVAAGTGGHIFPGLSVAEEIKKNTQDKATFLFWGDPKRLEARLVPEAGFEIKFLQVEQFKGRSKVKKILSLLGVGLSFLVALAESFRKKPAALVSVGGYVSVPVALAAKVRGVPVYLIEPNSVSGAANILVSKWATEAFVSPALPASKTLKCKIVKTGNPVRRDLPSLRIKSAVQKILVLGGSQGALQLSRGAVSAAVEMKSLGIDLKWMIQVGEKNQAEISDLVSRSGLAGFVTVVPFIKDISQAYAAADLMISRAGATTLAEMAVVGTPTILVPFPHAADDHQRLNAKALADVGAARMVDESDADFDKKLSANLRDLCASDSGMQKRASLHLKLKEFAKPLASHEISERILAQTSQKGQKG